MQTNGQEFEILQHLQNSSIAQSNAHHPGRDSVVQLIGDFDLADFRKALVFPLMGMDMQSRIESQSGGRLNKEIAINVSHQVVRGLDYLWKCGIAHGGKEIDLLQDGIC